MGEFMRTNPNHLFRFYARKSAQHETQMRMHHFFMENFAFEIVKCFFLLAFSLQEQLHR